MKMTWTFLLIASFSVFAAETSRPSIEIDDVDVMELLSPIYQGEESGEDTLQLDKLSLTHSSGNPWLRIAAEYETRPEWIDHLTLEFYALMLSPEKEQNLFRGVVQYVDIPKDRNHLAEMYMHFNSYERFHSHGRIKVAVLAKINGEIVAIDSKNSAENPWWETMPIHPRPLLNRLLTPFSNINAQDYEAQHLVPRK